LSLVTHEAGSFGISDIMASFSFSFWKWKRYLLNPDWCTIIAWTIMYLQGIVFVSTVLQLVAHCRLWQIT
jgi:hypothetical protein